VGRQRENYRYVARKGRITVAQTSKTGGGTKIRSQREKAQTLNRFLGEKSLRHSLGPPESGDEMNSEKRGRRSSGAYIAFKALDYQNARIKAEERKLTRQTQERKEGVVCEENPYPPDFFFTEHGQEGDPKTGEKGVLWKLKKH